MGVNRTAAHLVWRRCAATILPSTSIHLISNGDGQLIDGDE